MKIASDDAAMNDVLTRPSGSAMGRVPRHLSDIAAIVVMLLLATPSTASAYIDPGYGALVWQAVLASALGLGFKVYRMLARIWSAGRPSREDYDSAAE